MAYGRPCSYLRLMEIGIDLPQEVLEHPLLEALHEDITEIVVLDNVRASVFISSFTVAFLTCIIQDMVSYNKEQAIDDCHNVLAIVMHEQHLNLDEAIVWLSRRHCTRAEHALQVSSELQALRFSPQIDEALATYLDRLMNWPRANDCWNFESGRYFGFDGSRIQKERTVELYPKRMVTSQ